MSFSIWNPLSTVTGYIAGWFSSNNNNSNSNNNNSNNNSSNNNSNNNNSSSNSNNNNNSNNLGENPTSESLSGPDVQQPQQQPQQQQQKQNRHPLALHHEKQMRYGVALPKHASLKGDDAAPFVFESMKDVLEFCRRYQAENPRWKLAQDVGSAENFSLNAFDRDREQEHQHHQQQQQHQHQHQHQHHQQQHQQEQQQTVNREAVPFKSPSPQEMVQLRKSIEHGQIEHVVQMIESNPRFLIGSGDTPTILHEGCRYNAFHVAAKANQAEILRQLLAKLRLPAYLKRLYPDDNDRSTSDRIAYVVDLYLNMPDKTRKGETPLHFATKYGAVECVKLLLEQEECNRNAPNCEAESPVEIVCARAGGEQCKKQILLLFEQIFVIPIVRDYEGDGIPTLEAPVTVNAFQELYSPRKSSAKLLSGLIGPVTSRRAVEILSELKQTRYKPADVDLRNRDADKGFETIARNTARKHGAPWRESWPFLNSPVDLASDEGRAALNSHLDGQAYICGDSPSKLDYDVFSALGPVVDEIRNDASLPRVQTWLRSMTNFSFEEMTSWRTPKKVPSKPLPETHPDPVDNEPDCLVNLMAQFNVATTAT